MKFNSFAFIFLTPGFTPETNTITTSKDGYRFKAVGIDLSSKPMVLDVARSLQNEGYQIIELCGGFGPQWSYKVSEYLGMRVPVGGVYYGPEWREKLADLFRNNETLSTNSNETNAERVKSVRFRHQY